MADVFTIVELQAIGDPASADQGERFEWVAARTPLTAFDGTTGGGARAAPLKPWMIGGKQALVRTDYPNARIPSFQMLGPRLKPHTFRGRWDDRYNGAGYAATEARRFEAMCERGNPVRIQFGDRSYEGVIDDWDLDFGKSWIVGYEFSFNAANRPDNTNADRSPDTPANPVTLLDDVDLSVQAMLDADASAPRGAVSGTLADDVTTNLVSTATARDQLAATIDQRDIRPPEQPVDGFTRMATQFRSVKAAAFNALLQLAEARSDLDMHVMTAIGVLDFEDWTRSLRYMARLTMRSSAAGDDAATERAEPDAVRLYRPSAGEHLYAIARKFYGTPHAWRLIYERNSLRTFELFGNEILVIPERGGV
jgi:hypothetical protein